MSKNITKKILKYTAVFEPCEEGGYVVSVPKMPGLVTEGDSFEEATEMVKDAINGYLTVLQSAGEPIPDPDEKSFSTVIDVEFGGWKVAVG